MSRLFNVDLDARKHLDSFSQIISVLIRIITVQHLVDIFIAQSVEMLRHRDGVQAVPLCFGHHLPEISGTEFTLLGKLHMGVQIDFHKCSPLFRG
ncbi:hypothetical protein D3C76_1263520 [compost metagenome]